MGRWCLPTRLHRSAHCVCSRLVSRIDEDLCRCRFQASRWHLLHSYLCSKAYVFCWFMSNAIYQKMIWIIQKCKVVMHSYSWLLWNAVKQLFLYAKDYIFNLMLNWSSIRYLIGTQLSPCKTPVRRGIPRGHISFAEHRSRPGWARQNCWAKFHVMLVGSMIKW